MKDVSGFLKKAHATEFSATHGKSQRSAEPRGVRSLLTRLIFGSSGKKLQVGQLFTVSVEALKEGKRVLNISPKRVDMVQATVCFLFSQDHALCSFEDPADLKFSCSPLSPFFSDID
jgi:hypothetical protein